MKTRTYTELIQIPDFEGRLNYCKTHSKVGKETFGYDRYLNQLLYRMPEWKEVRRAVIIRDGACDLACPGYDIHPVGRRYKILVHHLNPITKEDILNRADCVLDPNNLVTVSYDTHQIIHYGYAEQTRPTLAERRPYDTCPWRN